MKKIKLIVLFCFVVLLAGVHSVFADPVKPDYTGEYLDTITLTGNSNPVTETGLLQSLIGPVDIKFYEKIEFSDNNNDANGTTGSFAEAIAYYGVKTKNDIAFFAIDPADSGPITYTTFFNEWVTNKNGSKLRDISHLTTWITTGGTTPPAPVPEPGTVILLGMGIIGLVALRRQGAKK